MTKRLTLVFLQKDGHILLAMKKRGFGADKWNGAGGKLESGERFVDAAVRECQEEIGVTPTNLQHVGHLDFFETNDPSFHHDCHIFTTRTWQGEPVETEEMRPQWFALSDIPYENMWADDILWLPLLLKHQLFDGRVTLDGDAITAHDIKTVKTLASYKNLL